MHRMPPTGPKTGHILPKTVASCLGQPDLPYNWSDKLRDVVLGICLARSVVLQDIVRTRGGKVKPAEKDLSEFLSRSRLDLQDCAWDCTVRALRRMGLGRFLRYRGKVVLPADSTTYAKVRSRRKKRRMPRIGTVRLQNVPSSETILVPGYSEFWTGLLLKDGTCLGITRRLFTETMLHGMSQNGLEEAEIRRAVELVREAFGVGVIVVADRGFRRKDLLEWLKKDLRADFVIRLGGNLRVQARGWNRLLQDLGPHWEERLRRFWRDDSKDPLLCAVGGEEVTVELRDKKSLRFNALCLAPLNRSKDTEPMFLATTLPIEKAQQLSMIVHLYSSRWTIETFFFSFKQSLGAHGFRVFSRWEAIDRLLAMAHMAFLVLLLAWSLAERARSGAWAELWVRVQRRLDAWFARPPELTLGYFFDILAMDFAERRPAWGVR